MPMTDACRLFVACLRYDMTGAPVDCPPLDGQTLDALYRLAEAHDAAHIVYRALKPTQALSALTASPAALAMEKAAHLAQYRYLLLSSTTARITQALSEACIPHVLLKGAVLRPLWRTPSSRVSCDVDVLVAEGDISRAEEALTAALECQRHGESSHDISLYTTDNVHIELHFSLIEEEISLPSDEILARALDAAEGDGYAKTLPDPLLYTYHIAHMAKHVLNGGCGVRPVLDTWVLCHRVTPDGEGRRAMLAEGELLTFAATIERLAAVWIDGAEHTAPTESLADFLLRGGVYGDGEGRVGARAGRGGRLRYVLSRLFVPYRTLKREFPILERHPYLLPVFEVYRLLALLFGKRGKATRRALREAKRQSTRAWGL